MAITQDAAARAQALEAYYRDLERLHRWLIAEGRAVRLGEPFPPPGPPPADELDRAVARLRALLDGTAAAPAAAP